MINAKIFEQITQTLVSAAPSAAGNETNGQNEKSHFLLESLLSHLNLVTREEFDVQQAVLQRTRQKLEALEKQVEALEQLNQQR